MIMSQQKNPTWWTKENDSAWDRAKAALQRDWDQTKHDLGGKEPDTDQNVGDTLKQAAGKEPIPPRRQPNFEQALRFGYGARSHYRGQFPKWNQDVETQLKKEYSGSNPNANWEQDRDAIRHGWNYEEKSLNE
jgi:hypothetical protein